MSAVPAAQLSSAELYAQAGVDVNALNFAEKAWMNWYLFFGNAALATGVASFLLHEVHYNSTGLTFRGEYFEVAIPDPLPAMLL